MATYNLTSGYNVQTTPKGFGKEFVTRNAEGDVISSVTLDGADAITLERDLIVANRLAAL